MESKLMRFSLASCAVLVLISAQGEARSANPRVIPEGIPTIVLGPLAPGPGVLPYFSSVAYHPEFRQYYSIEWSPYPRAHVWDAEGNFLSTYTSLTGVVESIYFNSRTNTIEGVTMGANEPGDCHDEWGYPCGLLTFGLDGQGLWSGSYEEVFATVGLPQWQSGVSFDAGRNRLYAGPSGAGWMVPNPWAATVVDRGTGERVAEFVCDYSPVGNPVLMAFTSGYDPAFDVLLTVERSLHRVFVHRLDGTFVGASTLPSWIVPDSGFAHAQFSYANGQAFVHDAVSRAVYGFRILETDCSLGCDDADPCTDDTCDPATGCAHVSTDLDGDGVCGDADECANSNLGLTVSVAGCDSGVSNTLFPIGCTLQDRINACGVGAQNHGQFASCVSDLTNDLKEQGILTGRQKGRIQRCAARSNPHPAPQIIHVVHERP